MDHGLAFVLAASLLAVCIMNSQVGCQDVADGGECIEGASRWYRGNKSTTGAGKTCQRWDVDKPHKPKHVPDDGGHHNYCRNPDNDLRGTWCYTTDNATRWQYCNISKCEDDSLVIWTNYDASSESTHLLRVQADPEIVKRETDSKGSFNVTVITGSNRSMTEYWALAADYLQRQLYFTDYRSEYIGIWKMEEKVSSRYFEGMAHGIECIAYDWVTHNLYWTDSEFKWVMAAESTFSYYTPVYRTSPDPAYGLAVHSVKRLLIFSTYKALGSKIIATDLAGKNETTLFKFPNVFDVTGITIDYTDDRMYWTDFTGYGGMVMSARLDGTNKTQHHYRGGSIFWGVAAYLDYLYVTDVHARYSMTGSRFYSVWIITKKAKQVFRYTLGGKPRGVAVYSQNEEFTMDIPPSSGECTNSEDCGHMCLPRINHERVCACSLGYHLDTNRKCVPKLVKDDYLLVADAGQGKVFQIPITENGKNNATLQYSIVPLGAKWKTVTVAVDPKSKYLYWSDKKSPSLNRAILDGSRHSNLVNSYANSILVDPHTGNLFYSDNDKDSIIISNNDGTKRKTIVKPEPTTSNTTSIRMIAQDLKYKYIYWTDTYSTEGEGKVMRSRFDGTEKEVVLDKLNWPHPITIDYRNHHMYVAEAKTAIIYELDLSTLVTINNTSVKQKAIKQYDVSAYITRISPYIIDLKIHKDMVYLVDGKNSRLESFNLTEGASSMAPYGPPEFFRVTTLSVFSESFYTKYIQPLENPCSTANCRSMCIAMSAKDYQCLCEDGKRPIGPVCVAIPGDLDFDPPTYDQCPDDVQLSLGSCATTTSFAWTAPVWTDEKTSSDNIVITPPDKESPASLGAGRHQITYSATDEAGNTGYCRFTVTVNDNQCPAIPNARTGMKRTNPTCQNRQGSSFNVSCVSPDQVVWEYDVAGNYTTHKWYQVYCSKGLQWVSQMTAKSECRNPPPVTTPTTSTKPAETSPTTAKTTTATTTTVSTPKTTTTTTTTATTTTTTTTATTTTKKTTPKTTITTTTTRKPTTTTRPATTTTTTTTTTTKKRTTTTTTAKPPTTTATRGAQPESSQSDESKKPVNATGNPISEKNTASSSGGLSSGIVAVIVILVLVLVIVIVVVVFITVRNRPVWAVRKFSFPIFWKSSGEDSVKMESSNNAYEIMT